MALISYYKFNRDTKDEVGGVEGSLTEGKYVAGIRDCALNFDDSSLLNLSNSVVNSTTGSIAISLWAKIERQYKPGNMILKDTDGSVGYNINIHMPWYSNNIIYWDISNNTSALNRLTYTPSEDIIGDGIWHHFVFQLDAAADKQEIYLDGILVATEGGKTSNYVNSSKEVRIGSKWQGSIDELKVFDTPLTAIEVRDLYFENYSGMKFKFCTDIYEQFSDGSKTKTKVVNRGAESGHGKTSKYSAYFNGDTNLAISVDLAKTPPSDADFSWGGWVMKNRTTVQTYPIFMSFGLPYIACDGASSPFRFSYRNMGSQNNISGTTIPALNTWYHVMAIKAGTTLKLYINGVEEASVVASNFSFDGKVFDVGRHKDSDTYRIWGRIDDVRFYERAISQTELDTIIDPTLDRTKVSVKSNGDVIVQNMEEDVEWTLWHNWVCPSLDASTTQFDSSIGSRVLSSQSDMGAAGWTVYLSNIDDVNYERKKGYSQQFYGSTPAGYIQKQLPYGYDMVRVKWGNWYSGTATIKLDGVEVSKLSQQDGKDYFVFDVREGSTESSLYGSGSYGYGAYGKNQLPPTIRIEELGIYWISEIWVGKKKNNNKSFKDGNIQPFKIINNGKSKNLMPYTTWTAGSGSVSSFIQNGSTAENVRKVSGDPWGRKTVIWNCVPDATSGPDGGWNYEQLKIDKTKFYRYSVWVRRNNINNGTFYHGIHGLSSTLANTGVYAKSTGNLNTNPYFYYSATGLPVNQWVLVVGYIWPYLSITGSPHHFSGIYTMSGAKTNILDDWIWTATSEYSRGRTYLYYTTNTAQKQQMCYPLFECCDGTEAPFIDLLSGKAYSDIGMIPDENIDTVNTLTEITKSGVRLGGDLINK